MIEMRALLLALLVACGGSARPVEPIANAPAGPLDPAPSPPTLRWFGERFEVEGLPAITRDGSSVVLAEQDSDGGRGNPNLTLVTIGRDNRSTDAFVVLSVDEAAPSPRLEKRLAEANAALAQRARTEGPLVPLVPLETDKDITQNIARGPGLEVAFTPTRLVIRRGTTVLLDRELPAAWTTAPFRSMGGGQACENRPYLGTVWLDEDRKLAMFAVNFTGTDMCWEPPTRHHVVVW